MTDDVADDDPHPAVGQGGRVAECREVSAGDLVGVDAEAVLGQAALLIVDRLVQEPLLIEVQTVAAL